MCIRDVALRALGRPLAAQGLAVYTLEFVLIRRFGVWMLGFELWGLVFGVWGSGFRFWGFESGVEGARFRFGVRGLGFRVWSRESGDGAVRALGRPLAAQRLAVYTLELILMRIYSRYIRLNQS